MDAQSLLVGRVAGRAQGVERPDDAAMPVVRVLERDRGGDRLVWVVTGPDRPHDLLRRHHARLRRHRPDLHAANGRCACALVVEGVRIGVRDELLSALGADGDPDQVAHGSAGYEGSRLLAHPPCGHLHQAVGRRVVAEDIVAKRCSDHRLAHLRAWHGDRVGTEVDPGHPINLTAECSRK